MKLPYRATTASGEHIDVQLPLHAETGSAICVEQMLSAILATRTRMNPVLGQRSR